MCWDIGTTASGIPVILKMSYLAFKSRSWILLNCSYPPLLYPPCPILSIFDITRTIYSNSERSEQFLDTEYYFNLFLEVSQIQ